MTFPTVTDHGQRILDRLLSQFAQAARLQDLLLSIAEDVQELEDQITAYANQSVLSVATGAFLDNLGLLVGEPRLGRNDTDYRAAIKLRIRQNVGGGTVEDVVLAALQFADAPIYVFEYTASIHVVTGGNTQSGIYTAINKVRPAGVELLGVVDGSGDRFGYVPASGTALPDIGGFGSVFDSAAGSPYAGIVLP